MEKETKSKRTKKHADFQDKYKRSSNYGYGANHERFEVEGDGEIIADSEKEKENKKSK